MNKHRDKMDYESSYHRIKSEIWDKLPNEAGKLKHKIVQLKAIAENSYNEHRQRFQKVMELQAENRQLKQQIELMQRKAEFDADFHLDLIADGGALDTVNKKSA